MGLPAGSYARVIVLVVGALAVAALVAAAVVPAIGPPAASPITGVQTFDGLTPSHVQ
jgi:hypothetical protein